MTIVLLSSVTAIAFLLYRVLDGGASLTFAQDELEQLRKANSVVLRYHRTRCDDFDEKAEADSFEKDGLWVIRGVEFLCEQDEDGVRLLIAQ